MMPRIQPHRPPALPAAAPAAGALDLFDDQEGQGQGQGQGYQLAGGFITGEGQAVGGAGRCRLAAPACPHALCSAKGPAPSRRLPWLARVWLMVPPLALYLAPLLSV
jgi:hypothetical protein